MQDKTRTKVDTATTPATKNAALASLLRGMWSTLKVVKIERIEIGTKAGWRATHRT